MRIGMKRWGAFVIALVLMLLMTVTSISETAKVPARENKVVQLGMTVMNLSLLLSDGTVRVYGADDTGIRDAENWKDIVWISSGFDYLTGVTAEGKVLIAGNQESFQNADQLHNIKETVAYRDDYFLALDAEGIVHCCGQPAYDNGMDRINGQRDVQKCYAGYNYTAAILQDGSLRVFGDAVYEDASKLQGVISLLAMYQSFIVHMDQSTESFGKNIVYKNKITGENEMMENIVDYALDDLSGGLIYCRENGTAGLWPAIGDKQNIKTVSEWTHVVEVGASHSSFAALRDDGTVYTIGEDKYGELQIDDEFRAEKDER